MIITLSNFMYELDEIISDYALGDLEAKEAMRAITILRKQYGRSHTPSSEGVEGCAH